MFNPKLLGMGMRMQIIIRGWLRTTKRMMDLLNRI
jgi:hypothetical protein